MSTFGRRSGTSATTGRKAETLTDPISGAGKHIYFGQRWLCVVQQHRDAPLLISAWHTEEEAMKQMNSVARNMERDLERWLCLDKRRHIYRHLSRTPPRGRPDVHYVVEGEVRD
jgi:hypothetical protein